MEVHKAITAHSKAQHEHVKTFYTLEVEREQEIERVLQLCLDGQPFTTDRINKITLQINELSRKGFVPQRRTVTKEMVEEYASQLRS